MKLAFIQGIGPLELSIVLVILLVVLGPKRLPALGRSLGSAMQEFRRSVVSRHHDDDVDAKRSQEAVVLNPPSAAPRARASVVAVDERPLEGEIVPERR